MKTKNISKIFLAMILAVACACDRTNSEQNADANARLEQDLALATILDMTDANNANDAEAPVIEMTFLGGYGGYGGSSGGTPYPLSWGPWSDYATDHDLERGVAVASNGNCHSGLCTKGNYNYYFKYLRCRNSKTQKPAWYAGRVEYQNVEWGEIGSLTKSDSGGVCVFEHPTANLPLFHDGCTGYQNGVPAKVVNGPRAGWQPANYGELFYGACVVHDLCYKAEGGYSGMSKWNCDAKSKDMQYEICERSYPAGTKRTKCKLKAESSRVALSVAPSEHYTKFNMGFNWSRNAICAGTHYKYDIVTGTCEYSYNGGGSSSSGGGNGGYGGG